MKVKLCCLCLSNICWVETQWGGLLESSLGVCVCVHAVHFLEQRWVLPW